MTSPVNNLELLAPTYHIYIAISHSQNYATVVMAEDEPDQPVHSKMTLLRERLHFFKERHWFSDSINPNPYDSRDRKYWRLISFRAIDNSGLQQELRQDAEKYRENARVMDMRIPGNREAYTMAQLALVARYSVGACE